MSHEKSTDNKDLQSNHSSQTPRGTPVKVTIIGLNSECRVMLASLSDLSNKGDIDRTIQFIGSKGGILSSEEKVEFFLAILEKTLVRKDLDPEKRKKLEGLQGELKEEDLEKRLAVEEAENRLLVCLKELPVSSTATTYRPPTDSVPPQPIHHRFEENGFQKSYSSSETKHVEIASNECNEYEQKRRDDELEKEKRKEKVKKEAEQLKQQYELAQEKKKEKKKLEEQNDDKERALRKDVADIASEFYLADVSTDISYGIKPSKEDARIQHETKLQVLKVKDRIG